MMEESIQLLCYHNWANLKLLNRMKEFPAGTYTKQLNGTFPSISATFNHIFNIDQQWFKRFNPESLTKTIDLKGIEETKEYFLELHDNMKGFIINHYDFLQDVQYENSKGEQFQNSIDELIRHITNHGTYHRGNISTMIRQLGYEGVSTDYIFFLRLNG